MTEREYAIAIAEIRARGVAQMHLYESEAAAMLERGSKLTAAEKRDYTAALHTAHVFGRCLAINADCLPKMMRHFVGMLEGEGEVSA
jgi:hypothetical protein